MSLGTGSRLGPYEITAPIGQGGMGEVYRAHDARVGRDVAVKVSSERFSERFDREARAIAALNHPNICTLFDVGPDYLVMEYVEGDEPRGPMPVEDAMRIAEQIALALEAAHERNIVHRDLKPGNIKVRPDGTVKVLDFGLAKVGGISTVSSQNSPTISMAATQAGVVLGTAAYMSPEQARGKNVDHRADIWAFGVVLYELITGKRLFQGEDITEVLASVVKEKPDLSEIPQPARRLIDACLQKDPTKRLQSIGDRRLLLDEWEIVPQKTVKSSRWLWPALAALLAVVASLALWAPWRMAPAGESVRFEIHAPPKASFTNWMAFSPDGRKVAFTARREDGRVRLWVRALDSLEARDIAETGANSVPFWSFDSNGLAYQYEGKLRRVGAEGGPFQVLCDTSTTFMGGAWSRDDVIIFGGPDGLQRVSANGGSAEPLTRVDVSKNETGHAAPVFLPDGHHFIYQRRSSRQDSRGIAVGSLDVAADKQSSELILLTELNALYSESPKGGRLLFWRDNALMAQPFDPGTFKMSGQAVQVANPVGRMTGTWINAATSRNGGLIYRTGGLAEIRQLLWYDRAGIVTSRIPETAYWNQVFLSHGGDRAVVQKLTANGESDLFVADLTKGLFTRFTFDSSVDIDGVWSPDDQQVVFGSERQGSRDLYVKPSSGATNEELLLKSSEPKIPLDWSRDGHYLLYAVRDPKNSWDLSVLPMRNTDTKTEPPKPTTFLSTPYSEDQARFSSDGRFVAYRSNESGRSEVYVRTFPDGKGKWQISKDGGGLPHWRSDGKELFFISLNLQLMAVDVTLAQTPRFDAPHLLFTAQQTNVFDAAGDGRKFLWSDNLEQQTSSPIIVVLNALQ